MQETRGNRVLIRMFDFEEDDEVDDSLPVVITQISQLRECLYPQRVTEILLEGRVGKEGVLSRRNRLTRQQMRSRL
jgi:hypothetical protein